MSHTATPPWWHDAVVYQIYPRSFADSDGDGIGDLSGIIAHLDHIARLGVDAIWLSPIHPSPMADFGYDVADYRDVDPVFGDLATMDALIAAAHDSGLKVILDWVPNHTSDQHPWFTAAISSPEDPHRDFYVWRDPSPQGGPPNNWRRAFSDEPAWTFDPRSGQYYLHLFLPEQPDLDWNNPEVRREMLDVLQFWMDRGIDGFRADVVHCIGKDPSLPDAPDDLAGLPACIFDHGPGTHRCLQEIRRVVDGDDPGTHLIVGETAVFDREQQLSYLGDGDELHLGFNFLFLHAAFDADTWRREITTAAAGHDARDAWPTWVLSNHDVPRHRTRFGSEAAARAAAVGLLALRGTPFLYQGEELGLADAEVPEDQVVDPGGRDGCRAPIPWTAGTGHGWGPAAWLPLPDEASTHNVETESADPASMLNHYRRLLHLRRSSEVLRRGDMELLDAPPNVVRFTRSLPSESVEVAINFGPDPVAGAVTAGALLAGTTHPLPEHGDDTLGPHEARIVALR